MANGNGGRGPGRPKGSTHKCTADRTRKICALIAAGQTQKAASKANAIGGTTFMMWMRKGADAKGAPCYKEFRRQIEQARNVAEMRTVKVVTDAIANGNLQAAIYWLRCRRREDWSPQERMTHAGDPENPLEVKHSGAISLDVSPEHLAEVARILGEADPEGE